MTERAVTVTRTGWMPSPALAGAIVVGVIGVVAAFVMSRLEPALIGIPLLLSAALGWDRRPAASVDPVEISTAVTVEEAAHNGDGDATLGIHVAASATQGRGTQRPDALHLRLGLGAAAPVEAVVTPRTAADLRSEVPIVHSGPQRVAAVEARALGADAAWASTPTDEAAVERVVRPRRAPLRSLPLPARLLGLTGQHISTRPGDGGEFRDIDLFHPGDRLRRIDWKATARAGRGVDLYVRRTTATSDAAVHLVLDARDDVSAVVADWPRAYPRPAVSSLDLAREAASSLAAAYAGAADRVGFDDLGESRRVLPPRAGARHRERVLRAIEATAANGAPFTRVRSPRLAPGSIVFVMSTFLDDQPVTLALTWRAAGHRVVAVDVLPARDARELPARDRLALRTIELERSLRLEQLQSGGVELLVWQDAAQREAALRVLASGRARR
ncbi:Uncharacterized conserved protein, DUF58 family, contains vWF domain [Leifsonia sp. 98AMF]|uniref:DUF58 domain-containing protein n=1 Tax=unclassified Leifsonia TaxID=2663824 RepID=UPI00087A58BF|nr:MULTISPECIES: DUF58 domain-containing protein [unclassified Leifsonia]SDH38083.1 Uncharacterized conserved protein, DUF58 family, contains vWF domain [Leifsonia sp. 197AMF]SDI97958.1 Uncharacterized conserved protein, DUF58 family, contains vWF domain [Leifsonia sp. 466MF]SDJ77053.1 Uncharacterized conserved protein, DUF58 family, contains vWF domain [Leifsonia sp. 157MF]SDO01313.1 Uncharacterized conserved protein, DUF58 family, contains vWF domain [Leifsonia sp. 509MF]SEN02724.1 Uncharact